MLMLVYARRQTTPFESVRPEDLNRDNLRPYAIEGGGEADNDQYSIANLRKPVMPIEGNGIMGPPAPMYTRPPIDDRLRSQLHDLESDQNAAPFDEIRIYEDEKDTVSVVTLESLGSIPDTERQPVSYWSNSNNEQVQKSYI
ncbi:cadherin cytoplasmic region [Teladorsagia circumcincta]|uniref:Cadherin cytoplasmic region n=1 Tax=Teladorsagia circumcincta TaxID=45464 RepID=A0A2G9T9K3_TELCI|nr:cadherin cytoplasmic region [Teladorsagia circumcincta]